MALGPAFGDDASGGTDQSQWQLPQGARDVSPEMREKARRVLKGSDGNRSGTDQAAQVNAPSNQPSKQARDKARSLIQGSAGKAPARGAGTQPQQSSASSEGRTIYIPISFSQGKNQLLELFDTFGDREDVTFVLRGMIEGTRTLNPTMTAIRKLLNKAETQPNITIDPTVFRSHDIGGVPAVVVVEDGDLVAKAVGTAAVDGVERRIERGKTGDLGHWGDIRKIAEADLTQVLKARADNLDSDAIQQRVNKQFDNYWARKSLDGYPEATETVERRFKPLIKATKTVQGPEGRTVFEKGERVNLLKVKPFSKKLIAFDGTREEQVALVERLIEQSSKPVIVTAARIDADKGWEAFNRLKSRFGQRLFRLPKSLAKRFRIRRLPSVVESQGNEFVIREIAP
jgi:type-F conjugative transfer system pilin assembly protein TrbC